MADENDTGNFEHWAGGLFPGNPLARAVGNMLDGADQMSVLRDTEPLRTDENWCFDCDNPIELCECEDDE